VTLKLCEKVPAFKLTLGRPILSADLLYSHRAASNYLSTAGAMNVFSTPADPGPQNFDVQYFDLVDFDLLGVYETARYYQ